MIEFPYLHLLFQEKTGDSRRKDNPHRSNISPEQAAERGIGKTYQYQNEKRIDVRAGDNLLIFIF